MFFEVKFITFGQQVFAPESKYDAVGVEGVDFIRKFLGMELPLDKIYPCYVCDHLDRVSGEISEENARKSERFWNHNKIEVIVTGSDSRLNDFIDKSVSVERNACTNEIKSAKIVFAVNFDKLVESWKGTGFNKDLYVWKDDVEEFNESNKELDEPDENNDNDSEGGDC